MGGHGTRELYTCTLLYMYIHIGGVAAVNRDGRVIKSIGSEVAAAVNRDGRIIHRKRGGGGGSYSQLLLTIGTWKRRQARAGLTTYAVYCTK